MSEPPEILLARHADRDRLRRDLDRGAVERVRRGAYLRTGRASGAGREGVGDLADGALRGERRGPVSAFASAQGARESARLRMRAVSLQLLAPVFSHESAATWWGWPTWTVPARTHVTQGTRRAGTAAADVARHFSRLPGGDVVERDGLLVTSRERTLVDVARTAHPLAGLVVADAALADGVDREAVLDRVAALGPVRGSRRARVVLDLADPGAESPWETWLRYLALRAGLPRPVTQHPIRTRLGTFRADIAWPEHGVLAEFDGRVKYTDGALGTGYDGAQALFAEKRRTDAIVEATGIVPFRATAQDRPDPTAARLLARFPRRFAPQPTPPRPSSTPPWPADAMGVGVRAVVVQFERTRARTPD
ncbi:hypothetical protein ET495_16380 [Xylanimonas allomyrinae]|uniref:AbiEi antitoxin C-terminal domain-containing protein n=1 Tax=Xylanimonas allomyrinae TaxID=2509459 RepID=A0A4P6ERI3_9MICO|nr:hypothetical protein [Xylanimonas allomyrinae]QAY64523.1 hypothetical protein ET495_16380 [Xylanimonas allomyrinae]